MTKLKLRLTTKNDYTELKEWWAWHRWSVPPTIELLDSLRFGIMVSHNNQNICAGFIYFTNAKAFGLIEFIVSTYKVKDKKLRREAIEFLINGLVQLAKSKNVRTLYTSLKNENLVTHYKKCGFQIGSTKTIEMSCHI